MRQKKSEKKKKQQLTTVAEPLGIAEVHALRGLGFEEIEMETLVGCSQELMSELLKAEKEEAKERTEMWKLEVEWRW